MVTVRRLAELRLVVGVICQRFPSARPPRAHVHVETERIGAGLKRPTRPSAIPTIEQRVGVAAARRAEVPTSSPRASILPRACPPDAPACGLTGLSVGFHQREPEVLAKNARHVPGQWPAI